MKFNTNKYTKKYTIIASTALLIAIATTAVVIMSNIHQQQVFAFTDPFTGKTNDHNQYNPYDSDGPPYCVCMGKGKFLDNNL